MENGRIPFPGKYFLLLILKISAFVFRREVYLMEEMGVFSEKKLIIKSGKEAKRGKKGVCLDAIGQEFFYGFLISQFPKL